MDKISKVEVYYNDWTNKFVMVVSSEDNRIEPFIDTAHTLQELEECIKKLEELYPNIEVKYYE